MKKTAKGLVEYCLAQVGRPYWYGCFGQLSSAKLYEAKKAQYPKYYTASDYKKQLGQKVHDCAGLIKGYLWCDSPEDVTPVYKASEDFGATSFYNKAKKKGKTTGHTPKAGELLFKGTDITKSHVGVYVGNGYVVEAKGHSYGTIKSKYGSSWKYWAECHLIDYTENDKSPATVTNITNPDVTEYTVTAKSGLRVRMSDSTSSGILAVMPYGTEFKVTSTNNNWAYGSYGKIKGYACITYLKKKAT